MPKAAEIAGWCDELRWLEEHAGVVRRTSKNRIRVVIPFEGLELWAEADTCVSAIKQLMRKLER